MSNPRTRTCQWCGIIADTVTAHMIHLHEEHPETIGRGPTMSREWSCGCGAKNRPVTATCEQCGAVDHAVEAANDARLFVGWYRRTPTDTPEVSRPMEHDAAVTCLKGIAGRDLPYGATWNERRLEVWCAGRRIAWLEVADVTHGTKFVRPN